MRISTGRDCLRVVAVLAMASPSLAQAQVSSGGSANKDEEVTISVDVRHDSNVARSSEERAVARGLDRSDERISPALNLAIERQFGRHVARLDASLGYTFYRRNSQLNRERIFVQPRIELDLPVCDPTFQMQYIRQQSELGDYAFIGEDSVDAVKNTEQRQEYLADLRCGREGGLQPTFGVRRVIADNSNPLRERADFDSTEFIAGLAYERPALGEIMVYASTKDTDLPHQQAAGLLSGYELQSFGARYKRDIGSRFTVDGGIATVWIKPDEPTFDDRSSVTWDVSLTAILGSRLQLIGGVRRDVNNTLTSDALYQTVKGYDLRAVYAANDRLRLNAGVSFADRDYFYGISPVQPFISSEKQFSLNGGASYDINRRFRLALSSGYLQRDADQDYFDYDSFFAALTLVAKF